ncbi:MAG: DeoR/GlpR family DNA-binding transcription regulator [Ancrocorticia sp.]
MAHPQSKDERQRLITEFILERGSARIEELQDLVEVSPMTLYRDLHELESARIIDRFRGEITAVATTLTETSMRYRVAHETDAKRQLAAPLVPIITRGMSVLLDDSSTALMMIEAFTEVPALTIITNNWQIIQLAARTPNWELITIGGQYNRHLDANFGPASIDMLGRIRADVALFSAAAITEGVVYHPYEAIADFKEAMRRSASASYIAATAPKFGRTALHRVADTADFDGVLVEAGTDPAIIAELEARGATVLMAGE